MLRPDDRVLRPFPPAVYDNYPGLTTAYDDGEVNAKCNSVLSSLSLKILSDPV